MRSVRYLPLAFIAGYHGFALFAPYAAVVLAVAHVVYRRRRKTPRAIPLNSAPDSGLDGSRSPDSGLIPSGPVPSGA